MIEVDDWNDLVIKTYGKPYDFQQQDGCMERGTYEISVPMNYPWDFKNSTVPEEVNHPEMGVSFAAWLERDPEQKLNAEKWNSPSAIPMWWQRNFYPCIDMIANDLYNKGLLPKGDYTINIDW